jgi:hypothetical protein
MGEGRIEEIIQLGGYCISVAGKPVGVRIPPSALSKYSNGIRIDAGFLFFVITDPGLTSITSGDFWGSPSIYFPHSPSLILS